MGAMWRGAFNIRKRSVMAVMMLVLVVASVEGLSWIGGVTLLLPRRLAFLFWVDDEAALRAG